MCLMYIFFFRLQILLYQPNPENISLTKMVKHIKMWKKFWMRRTLGNLPNPIQPMYRWKIPFLVWALKSTWRLSKCSWSYTYQSFIRNYGILLSWFITKFSWKQGFLEYLDWFDEIYYSLYHHINSLHWSKSRNYGATLTVWKLQRFLAKISWK